VLPDNSLTSSNFFESSSNLFSNDVNLSGCGVVSALLDTVSSINLMSYFLYNSLSKKYKSELLTVTSNKIVLANNQEIQIDGIATITGIIEGNQTSFDVYVLKDTSHSLLLDTEYLRPNGVILNFSSLSVHFSKSKFVSPKRLNFPPKSCVLEFRYRKSTQNLYKDKLSSFEPVFNPEFGRFLFEANTMGLDMGICSFSFTGAIIP
jgi:hypothetical protein